MGVCVTDVTRSLGSKAVHRLSESAVDPRELLWGILHTLSQIRGSPSYLFAPLLERCKNVIGLDGSINMGNFLPTLGEAGPRSWANEPGWNLLASMDRGVDEILGEGEHLDHGHGIVGLGQQGGLEF